MTSCHCHFVADEESAHVSNVTPCRIKRLVKQLFFRLNQQQFRNKKYKHKDNSEKKPVDIRGLSEQTAIDVDAIDKNRTITTAPGQSSGGTALYGELQRFPHLRLVNPDARVNESSSHATVAATAESSDFDQHCGGQQVSPDRALLKTDIYAVPSSPPVSIKH